MTTETLERPAEKAAPKRQLSPASLKLAEHCRATYRIGVGSEITLEDVLKPTFWEHHSRRLKVGDIIEVVAEDLSWYANVMVTVSDAGVIRVAAILTAAISAEGKAKLKVDMKAVDEAKVDPKITKDYKIQHIPNKGFMVRENVEGSEWIGPTHSTKEEAERWVREHVKTINRK